MFIFCVCIRAPVIQPLSQSENEQKNLNITGVATAQQTHVICVVRAILPKQNNIHLVSMHTRLTANSVLKDTLKKRDP